MNRYGCFNTPRKDWFYVRLHVDSEALDTDPFDYYVPLVDTSTTECQYRKTTPDPKCEGCTK